MGSDRRSTMPEDDTPNPPPSPSAVPASLLSTPSSSPPATKASAATPTQPSQQRQQQSAAANPSPPPFALTPTQREKIKEELLARQKAAAAALPPAPLPPTPLPQVSSQSQTQSPPAANREDAITQAINFLTSPSVRDASWESKAAFLRGKGMSEGEIGVAVNRAGVAVDSYGRPAQIPHMSAIQHRGRSWAEVAKNVLLVVLLSGGAAIGVARIVKHYLLPTYTRFQTTYAEFQHQRQTMITAFLEKFVAFAGLYTTPAAPTLPSPPPASEPDSEPTLADLLTKADPTTTLASTIRTHITKTTASLSRLQSTLTLLSPRTDPSASPTPLESLRASTRALAQDITTEIHVPPGMAGFYAFGGGMGGAGEATARLTKAVADTKSEIRGLKGMALNRRNFVA
ncbi:uncharacterized protein EV422DRAFT_513218 [Fimicolochytrium jonesii]|uniref:uncharacterized protein n=1 Tax=Fimicolochytrium jonesii TaxID=1396493 RepID=UPI0022FE7094|nr:uncharacterized protein EV422DRAFT_513218 [Fimicolochytrium jonesii]KAI8827258.1 hypothetical protein EV422DRAFT_513218 [Fimicolochytrium jonesii]